MKRLLISCLLSVVWVQTGLAQEAQSQTAAPAQAAPVPKEAPKKETRDSLEAAYKREFAFLQAQKKELEQRLKSFKAQADNTEKTIRQKIDSLEQKNIELSANEDKFRTSLADAERKDDVLNDSSDLLQMTYSQGNASLDAYGRSLEGNPEFAAASDEIKLAMLFRQATDLLKDLSNIRHQSESFFTNDGAEVSGTVVKVGNIAAYGVSDTNSGILVPAGAGRLKLWGEPAADVAKGVLAGKVPSELKIFLFESKEKAVDEKQEKNVLGVIESGGMIGWVIVGLGGVALILIGIRCLLLYLASRNPQSIARVVIPLLQNDQEKEALSFCQQQKGPFARILMATIQNSHGNRDHMDDVISEAMLHEAGALNRFGSAILVIASVSPLLGLLGTVTGMISTFDIITEFGTGDPKLLSSGISIALVTTELGLVVAIPAVLAGTLLSSWSDGIKYDLEEVALKATNILLDRENPERMHKHDSAAAKTGRQASDVSELEQEFA
ncbi:MotA/TolQ/ExbB proton channel family protein [Methylobacter sp. YRD-M1]|uniref:MotA/TolQ/ExbB proton channel family protein n=1 Tax=Methylobacter sp. YRD-M1 TaxID=2911520 RepID=UPI00227A4CE8|nr:MotA/TolQ/ExbB proton channel family protein [Methylobacter sp. YRD-M1]WAK01440.1 MotA/TolQ/ExbB proton channel family protein [Methylobacter sp. YRD-M1]